MSEPTDVTQLPVHPRLRFKGNGSADIESLNYDGRGVAHVEGKATFVEGALPGEHVEFGITRRKPTFDNAVATAVHTPSPERILEPRCPYFGQCGGCSLQHIRDTAQIGYKQEIVREQMHYIGKVEPEAWAEPLTGPCWGYRRKARLGARLVPKKGGVLVGFREKSSAYIADMTACAILDPRVSAMLPALRTLIASLSIPDKIPQIEVAAADDEVALVFRHLSPLTTEDRQHMTVFAEAHDVQVWLQPEGPDSAHPLAPDTPPALVYRLPESNVEIAFSPMDFTQINADINRKMVAQALDWLAPDKDACVLDLFCGLGNFSLPLARRAGKVIGIEGSQRLVEGAQANANRNGITNAEFRMADLYAQVETAPWGEVEFDYLLLDPPRSGAMEVIRLLPEDAPRRIVYVSCYPGTLARDANYLVNDMGYRLVRMGVMDMFPQTTHVETMALFEKTGSPS